MPDPFRWTTSWAIIVEARDSLPIGTSTQGVIQVTYWRYWQLSAAPFTGEVAQPIFRGATVEEAIARVEFLVSNRRKLGVLLGASGVGKSSILRHCAQNLMVAEDIPSVQALRISMLGMSGGELTSELASRLTGCRSQTDSMSSWKLLCDYFRAAEREGTQTVLLVDDTECCGAAAEADLARLLSISFPLTIVFSVEANLASSVSRSLFEQTELQIELPGWDLMQTAEFLAWTAQRLGRTEPMFTDTAIERIQELSQGIIRRIVQISDLALVAGAGARADYIDHDCVDQVAFELPQSYAA